MLLSELMDFQAEDVRRMHRDFYGRVLNANPVGTGKTVETCAYADRYLVDDPPGPIVAVVPAHLKENWESEVYKHLGRRVFVANHERVPDGTELYDPNAFCIVNYDILVPSLWKPTMALPPDSWAAFFRDRNPRMVIGDEGHYLKSWKSARTRAFDKMVKRVEYVHILTGTPITNKPGDLWPILHILYPKLFNSQWEFLDEYTHLTQQWWGWQPRGARNLDQLHRLLSNLCMIRRRKEDVLGQLPAVRYSVCPLKVDLTEYRRAEADFIGWLELESPLMARNAAKAEELNRMGYLRRMIGELKVDAVAQIIKDYLQATDDKLLVGALHYNVTGPLMDALGDVATLIDGKIDGKEKHARTQRFNINRNCRVCVANLNAGGTGWNCTATSNVDVIELPWVPGDIAQFVGRVHGIQRGIAGTAAQVRFWVVEDTIDADMCNALQTKQRWMSTAIDGDPKFDSLPVYDQVLSLIKSRVGERQK